MSTTTKIEWTEATWNPVTGCTELSEGCDHCYARTFAERWRGVPGHSYEQGFDLRLWPDRLGVPLRWRKPRQVFVNSMSDLFHTAVPDEFIARVFAVMAATPRHTYQCLTKRHGRMRSLLTSARWPALLLNAVRALPDLVEGALPAVDYDAAMAWVSAPELAGESPAPLPNVWLGVSAENQKWADLRVRTLMETPAAVRFLSCEPLLGPITLNRGHCFCPTHETHDRSSRACFNPNCADLRKPDWIIAGGESGPGARPMHPDWARKLRDDCQASDVPFFFKQWGGWAPAELGGWYSRTVRLRRDGTSYSPAQEQESPHDAYLYAPRSKGLRQLDGREWSEYPRGRVTGERVR
ncbi:MAG: phage Gp37/Gp68 family protein [Pseudonocardia sp.]|nr:phage Gp37/Gp68 family protein [Pseudonocardia sp.]